MWDVSRIAVGAVIHNGGRLFLSPELIYEVIYWANFRQTISSTFCQFGFAKTVYFNKI